MSFFVALYFTIYHKNKGWVSRLTSDNVNVYFIQGKWPRQW